jgi:hypothetical protein
MVAVALVLGVAFFAATQVLNGPAIDDRALAPTETAIAQAVATAAAAPTRAPASLPRTAPQATPAPQPTAAPTVAVAVAQVAPTIRPAATSAPTAPAAAEPTVLSPTVTPVDPALDEEVRMAYLHYFDVRDQALYNNDPTGLDAVVEGQPLTALKQTIADQRAGGKALVVDIRHHYGIYHIEGDSDDVVAVVDYSKDLSYWVDANTHLPLPGQTIPSSEDQAPQVNVLYRLRNIDDVWKVIGRYSNVGSEASP